MFIVTGGDVCGGSKTVTAPHGAGWAGEDCDECAAGYEGDACDVKVVAAPPPPKTHKQFTDCGGCVAAGFGWSVKKGKCGGYANKNCPSGEL